MLVLFVFINSLAAGSAMIETRLLGMYSRMTAAPVRPLEIVLGEMLVYVTIALLQAGLIIGVGAVVFGVHWGNPLAAVVLTFVWALVGAGAGMLAGTVFRTPEQATSVGVAAGMVLGMLGGCMWPLEIVPAAMRTIGHFTPQAWAVDAWTELLSRAGNVGDIARQLLVLLGFAVVLVVIAGRRLRHVLTA
jgi:ABC-2 type transport system permease protein